MKRSPEVRAIARRLGRARLLTKRRVLRHFGHPLLSRRGLRYLARDPEVDSSTYHMVNEEDLAAVHADLTGDPLQIMSALFREAPDSLDVGRGIGHKSRIPVSGFHGPLYALTRRLRPRHVLETGVLDGVGSLLVLNRVKGPDGRWSAPDMRPVFAEAKTAGTIAEAATRDALTRALGLEWGPVKDGVAEPSAVPQRVREHFSVRHAEILEEAAAPALTSKGRPQPMRRSGRPRLSRAVMPARPAGAGVSPGSALG